MKEVLIDIKNLSCENNTGRLQDVSFTVYRGEDIVLYGPENSGIKLLLSVILGFNKKYSGDIFFMGKNMRDFDYIDMHSQKKEIGYLHEDYGLISNMSVDENISLPLRYHSKLSEVEIKSIVTKLIFNLNLDHCKKLRPIDLTPSEILKTAYARSIALDPDILIVEHAFGGQSPLDIKAFTTDVYKRANNPEKAQMFVTYNPEKFLEIAETFILFFDGKIVFSGDTETYRTTDNPYVIQYRNVSETGPMSLL
jgi:phospholipid/cholesterol/gamma-HCH transport system ATP-binding protein